MSVVLPSFDLSVLGIGQAGSITLQGQTVVGPAFPKDKPHLRIFNESGHGLNITFKVGRDSHFVPAGAWPVYEIQPNETELDFTVTYILPGAPVKILQAVYYQSGEAVPETPVLGNSPIGIGGQVSTVGGSATSVVNDNNPLTPSNVFVESTPSGAGSSTVSIATDGTVTIKGDVAGVLTTLIQTIIGAASGASSVILGDSARQVEILGKGLVDGTLIGGGGVNTGTIRDNSTGATQATLVTAGITIPNKLTLNGATAADAAGPVNFTAGGGIHNAITQGGLEIIAFNGTNGDTEVKATVSGGRVLLTTSDGTARAQVDSTGLVGLTGSIFFPVAGSFKSVTRFTGTGNGTVATGTTNPFSIVNDACTVSGSSQTIGMTIATSSVVTTGAGLAWHGTAYA